MNTQPDTIGQYLLHCLHDLGVEHVFGIPGDYILKFYDEMVHSPVTHIGTTREDTAAFAADGYARCRGMGALAVTYGVGALSVVNAVAGAYAESSPLVVISGAPGIAEQRDNPLIHHRFGPFTFQREIFERITCATAVLEDPMIAFRQIDRALAAARHHSKPVYIELPRDRVMSRGMRLPADEAWTDKVDLDSLAEAVAETIAMLKQAQSPVAIAGVEVHRCFAQDALGRLIDKARLPAAATLTGKSTLAERHPGYVGVYEGAMSAPAAREAVENADLALMLGVTLNDIDTGIYTARLDPLRTIRAAQGEVVISHHRYTGVPLAAYIEALSQACPPRSTPLTDHAPGPTAPGFPGQDQPMTVARLIGRLNEALTPELMVVCDTGDCLFAGIELRVHERSEFLASAYYTTMGFAVPAALGAQLARRDHRALILVGDGAFQMTGTELSTHCRLGLAPIVIVFNNRGYSTERYLLEGPFNDIAAWRHSELGALFGPMQGHRAETEDQFEQALATALAEISCPSLIEVMLRPDDPSPAMQRLTEHMRTKVAAG